MLRATAILELKKIHYCVTHRSVQISVNLLKKKKLSAVLNVAVFTFFSLSTEFVLIPVNLVIFLTAKFYKTTKRVKNMDLLAHQRC